MNTAMKVYESSEFLALDPNSDTALAMRENMDGETFSELDLIRVKTPTGGGLLWTVDEVSGPKTYDAIEGICVFKAKKGLIWPTLEMDGNDQKPVMVSNDCITGKLNVPIEDVPEEMMESFLPFEIEGHPNCYDWAKLPQTQWGTGKNGIGKWAKELILLFILRKDEALPLFIQVGSGSTGNVRKFFIRMQNVPFYRAVVSLSLKEEKSAGGIKYSQIVPKLIGTLSPEMGEVVKSQYTDKLRASHEAGLIDVSSAD